MKCHRIHKLMPLYSGGELSLRKLKKIRNHISCCTTCEQESRSYSSFRNKVKNEARSRREQSLTETELQNLMNRTIEFQKSMEFGSTRLYISRWKFSHIGVVLVTLMLIVIVGFSVYNYLIKDTLGEKQELIVQNNKFMQLDFSIDNLDQDIKEIYLLGERIDLSNIQFLYIFKEKP